jgi:hypothetical protein
MLSAYTPEQIISELKAQNDQVKIFYTDFTMETSGTGKIQQQKGGFSYTNGVGTFYWTDTPAKTLMFIRSDGTIIYNGKEQPAGGSEVQMGDLFYVNFLSRFNLKIQSEDSNGIELNGFLKSDGPAAKKIVTFYYNKNKKVIDSIRYKGNGNDYPYEVKIFYSIIDGLPVPKRISMITSAFSITIASETLFANMRLEKK